MSYDFLENLSELDKLAMKLHKESQSRQAWRDLSKEKRSGWRRRAWEKLEKRGKRGARGEKGD